MAEDVVSEDAKIFYILHGGPCDGNYGRWYPGKPNDAMAIPLQGERYAWYKPTGRTGRIMKQAGAGAAEDTGEVAHEYTFDKYVLEKDMELIDA